MILSLRFKNFYSLADDVVIDFTADLSHRGLKNTLGENLIEYNSDKFVNVLGIFGANAAGKSNIVKAMDFCRKLVLNSHLHNEGKILEFEPFKFYSSQSSEFYINFVSDNIEYEYSFTISKDRILGESLYYYPNRRRAKVFVRENTFGYSYGKGVVQRPSEVEASTGVTTLFLSRASSMNRPIMKDVYRFFAENIWVGFGNSDFSDIAPDEIERNKDILLKALEAADSDIMDITVVREPNNKFHLITYHKENPQIAFDFEREESDGTKRLFHILLLLTKYIRRGTAFFLDEFDLKMHLKLAEFLLDFVRASKKSQLIFTSHNQALMNPRKLRREQIIIVTKDSTGKSEFVALSEFSGIDSKTDIQRSYLLGRYDGVPYIEVGIEKLSELMAEK